MSVVSLVRATIVRVPQDRHAQWSQTFRERGIHAAAQMHPAARTAGIQPPGRSRKKSAWSGLSAASLTQTSRGVSRFRQIPSARTKAGLEGAAATLMMEAVYHGVRCGVIHPGYTDTPMVRSLGEEFIRERIIPLTQLRRLIKPGHPDASRLPQTRRAKEEGGREREEGGKGGWGKKEREGEGKEDRGKMRGK